MTTTEPIPDTEPPRVAILIPAYLEAGRISEVVRGAFEKCGSVLVVDDGSPDTTAAEAEAAGAEVIRHTVNQGKGAAIQTGLRICLERGFDFVICMDGDGQHLSSELDHFIQAAKDIPTPGLVIGNRMSRPEGMPAVRRFVNSWMSSRISRICKQNIPDTQCGFRMIHSKLIPHLFLPSRAYEYESEMLFVTAAAGFRIASVPVTSVYGTEKSKIHPIRDTRRFFKLLDRYRHTP